MNIFTRVTNRVSASFDWVMNQIENHDALVQAAIREIQESGVKARVQLGRVQSDGKKMELRIAELDDQIVRWAERAKKAASNDEAEALECLKRKRDAERERKQLSFQLGEHTRFVEQLTKELKELESKVAELKRRRNAFSARQHRADATRAGQLSEYGVVSELDDIFERWEMKLGEYDLSISPRDPIAEKFEAEEERESLQKELQELLEH